MTHLSIDQLRQWRDAPSDDARTRVVEHLASCDQCSERYAELIRTRPLGDDRPTLDTADFVARGLELSPVPVTQPRKVGNLTTRFAFAAAVLLAVGASWLAFESRQLRTQLSALEAGRQTREREVQQQAGEERSRREQLDRELQEERRTRAVLEQELARQRETALPSGRAAGPLLSLFLTPGRVRARGETKAIDLPSDAAEVRLMLATEGQPSYQTYEVELLNSDGARVWNRTGIRGGQQLVMVTVPARLLAEDDYELALRGVAASQDSERAGQYYFTVRR